MAPLEKKIITAILGKIRARRGEPTAGLGDVQQPSGPVSPAKIRETRFSDFEAIHALKHRWGLIPDSFQNWERLWRDNPAIRNHRQPLPMGWVLEANGKVVGYLGNIASTYRYGDRTLTAVTGHGLVVEPAYRSLSMTLNAAFFRQKSVDLYLTTTAIASVGRIAVLFKSDPLPQEDYDRVLFWVIRPLHFARSVTERLHLQSAASAAGGILASAAITADKALRRRWPRIPSTNLELKDIPLAEIGDDFQILWEKKLAEKPRLLSERDPATLRWHFQTPGDSGTTLVIGCYRKGELAGYAVVRNDSTQVHGLRRTTIADLIAERDDAQILRTLFAAAYDRAKRSGSHIFELLGFPPSVRSVCSAWNPYSRKYPACPFFYKAADPALHKTLADAQLWYASPFDGDATLMPLSGHTNE